jgi:hypothetical protein
MVSLNYFFCVSMGALMVGYFLGYLVYTYDEDSERDWEDWRNG